MASFVFFHQLPPDFPSPSTAGPLLEYGYVVGSPYCDIGWIMRGEHLVIGFALDNMLRGAASQAIQNMNLLMNWPIETGLVPEAQSQ